jgi:hypothetical protein
MLCVRVDASNEKPVDCRNNQRVFILVPRDGLEPSRRVTPADFECSAFANLMFDFKTLSLPGVEFVLSLLLKFLR